VHLGKFQPGINVFIANIGDWNAFEYQGGKPLKVRLQDSSLRLHSHQAENQLLSVFCDSTDPKIWLNMQGNNPLDQTKQALNKCQ